MRSVLALLILMISFTTFGCDELSGRVLLANGETVEVDVHGKPVVKLLAREIGPNEIFSARVLGNYAGFDCEVKDVVKLSQGCFEISVNWSPGADFSGCDVEVSSTTGKSYKAFLFMDFFAH